jgi:predicted Zn-dependent protease with MMP-like domain
MRVSVTSRGTCTTLAAVGSALLLLVVLFCRSAPASAASFPRRNTSSHPQCANQPPRPRTGSVSFTGQSYPVVGAIDANGCDAWPYELASAVGVYRSFFAGPGFRSGEFAYEFGNRETTELIDGHQLIKVVDPTSEWRRVYKGYDACTSRESSTVCIAPALEARPDDVVLYIPAGILLGILVLFVVHYTRPAGPIRRRRHYRAKQKALVHAVSRADESTLGDLDIKQLQRRLARLEKFLAPELSESQHHWFHGLVAGGRHGMALESLTRWLAESPLPVPDHIREEVLWIASSLAIEQVVRPVLDAGVLAHDTDDGPTEISGGFDVPLAAFEAMVAEAVDSLPEPFGRAMTNVAVVVAEAGDPDVLGLYQGHPLTRYHIRQWSVHPDKITIFRRTICEHSRSEEEVRAHVYRTVIHEIAHHFGIDDPRLRELGW